MDRAARFARFNRATTLRDRATTLRNRETALKLEALQRSLAVAVGCLTALVLAAKWGLMLVTRGEWISAEGWHVYQLRALLEGYPLYADPAAVPHIVMNYTPLFVLAQLPFAAVFGADVWIGRALVIASVLGCAAVVFVACRRRTGSAAAAAMGASLFLFNPITLGWSGFARVDYPALVFGLTALLLLDAPVSNRRDVLSAALIVASALVKQNALLVLLPTAALALLSSTRRSLVPFGLALVGSGLAALALCLALSASWSWFWWQTVSGNVVSYSLDDLLSKWRLFGVMSPGVLILGLVGLRARWDQWTVFTALSLLSALSVIIVNGGMNYFMTAIAGLAVLGASALKPVWARVAAGVQLGIGLAGASGLLLADIPYADQVNAERAAASAWLSTVQGPAIVDYALAADPRADHSVFLYEYFTRARGGRLDPSFLADRLAAREIEAVVWRSDSVLPDRAEAALAAEYAPIEVDGQMTLYRARN